MKIGAILLAAMSANAAMGCELPPGGKEISNGERSVRLSYRPEPAGLAPDRQFSLILHVCANGPVEDLTVDARMPAHRHGMNYKPGVAMTGPDAWRADGLLLHMPGQWELMFGVRVAGKTERLVDTVVAQ